MAKKTIRVTNRGIVESNLPSINASNVEFILDNELETNIGDVMSPFIVGSSSLAKYNTIQQAVDDAVAESISSQSPKVILIEGGAYNEDIIVNSGNVILKSISDSRDVSVNGTIEFLPSSQSTNSYLDIKNISIIGQSGDTKPLITMNGAVNDYQGRLLIINCSLEATSNQEALFITGSLPRSNQTFAQVKDSHIFGAGPSSKPVMFVENSEFALAARGVTGIDFTNGDRRTVLSGGLNSRFFIQNAVLTGGSVSNATVVVGSRMQTFVGGFVNIFGGPAISLSIIGSFLETYTSVLVGVPSVSASVNPASVSWAYADTISPAGSPSLAYTTGILTASISSTPTPV